jgi:cellulose biosynthesis protein BcsQ
MFILYIYQLSSVPLRPESQADHCQPARGGGGLLFYLPQKQIAMAKIVGFINQKGGVGKSFTTKVAANALCGAKYAKKVMVVDCDEQGTVVAGRKLDMAMLREKNKDAAFAYEVATCAAENLLGVIAGEKPMRALTVAGYENRMLDASAHDFVFVDMPGRGQNRDILTLLASIDYAVVVTLGDTSETMSTMDFFSVIQRTQQLRAQGEIEPIKLALMYNQFENTATYKGTVAAWEQQRVALGLYSEVLYLSKMETYRKYNDTYTDMLRALKSNKALSNLHNEFSRFIETLLKFLEQ